MEDLKSIIQEIITYKKLGLSNLSDDCILDCSTRIFNSQNIEQKKEKKSEPATERQVFALKKMGFEGDYSTLTKLKASELIDSAKKK